MRSRVVRRLPSAPRPAGRRSGDENARVLDLLRAEVHALGARIAEQEQLRVEQESRIAALEHIAQRPQGPYDPADIEVVSALDALGVGWFKTSSVMRHVKSVGGRLRDALAAADVETPRDLGWLLRRLEGIPVAACVVKRRQVEAREGVVWRIVRVVKSAGDDEPTSPSYEEP